MSKKTRATQRRHRKILSTLRGAERSLTTGDLQTEIPGCLWSRRTLREDLAVLAEEGAVEVVGAVGSHNLYIAR